LSDGIAVHGFDLISVGNGCRDYFQRTGGLLEHKNTKENLCAVCVLLWPSAFSAVGATSL